MESLMEGVIELSPAKEWLGEVCINEETGVWCTVVQTQETTAQEVMSQLRKKGYKTYGMYLRTEERAVSQARELL